MVRNVFVLLFQLCATQSFSQWNIAGAILNNEGRPLIGASVVLDGINKGTTTDYQGVFLLAHLTGGSYKLKVSYVGFENYTQSIQLNADTNLTIHLNISIIEGEEIIVRATRANNSTPVTFSTIDKKELTKANLGQDLPMLIGMEPSLVSSSDAGAGVGYTSLWVRGSNIQHINVTVNGVPLNDPESHGVFWVNMPDFASSVESVQIQRGVGTSTNGGGAFGATMNLETDHTSKEPFGEINSSTGSFNTWKNNVRFGTGIFKDHWAFEGRASKITSDGYIDRASTNLQSFFLQGGYYSDKTILKAVLFNGKEKTYQSWNGIDEATMETDRTYNSCGAIYDKDWNVLGFYDNETDNYQQDHFQLHLTQQLINRWQLNASLHYTNGSGYYEQYYSNQLLSDFPIGNQYFGFDSLITDTSSTYFYRDTVTEGDMVVKQWLENQFYGAIIGLQYSSGNLNFTLGGALNNYANAKHFGEIIWAEYAGNTKPREKYYENVSNKMDGNLYTKADYKITSRFGLFVDLQLRYVDYIGEGTDNWGVVVDIDKNYTFFNPKSGFTYNLKNAGILYASYAMSHREPIRTDFLDAPEGITPEPETLQDVEAGIRKQDAKFRYSANIYYMLYTNQLALTGAINDVGSPIRENVGKSYRLGFETDIAIRPIKWMALRATFAIGTSNIDSKRIEDDTLLVSYNDVKLSYSPDVISGFELKIIPLNNFEITGITKYVSRQYLDLTENKGRSLDPYAVTNLQLMYTVHPKWIESIDLTLLINNIFNTKYESNGYVWSDMPYYYPQAGINFLAGISLRF